MSKWQVLQTFVGCPYQWQSFVMPRRRAATALCMHGLRSAVRLSSSDLRFGKMIVVEHPSQRPATFPSRYFPQDPGALCLVSRRVSPECAFPLILLLSVTTIPPTALSIQPFHSHILIPYLRRHYLRLNTVLLFVHPFFTKCE